MAINGKVFNIADSNAEDSLTLFKQLRSVLGETTDDPEVLFLSEKINQWAYFKPLKSGVLTWLSNADRINLKHGLVQNASTFYLEYDRVSSGWMKRLRDFDGYNHAATPPIRDTSAFNKTLSFSGGSSGQIVLNTNAFANPGSEIALNEIAQFQTYANWYVGMMLYNKTSGKGYYQTTEWTLNQYINGEASSGIPFLMEAEAPNIEDGVTYDFYYCLSMNKDVSYRAFSRSDIGSSLYVLCCDATHGHASVKAVKMGWDYIDMTEPEIYCTYRGYGSAQIGVNNVTIKSSWNFVANPYTDEKMQLKAEIGEFGGVTPTSEEVPISSAETDFRLFGTIEIDEFDIVDYYEYIVPIYIYGKFATESSYKTLGYGRYDVVNKAFVSWYNYV